MIEAKLNELEAKMCLAEDLLDALNRTVFHQQQQIDRLQNEVHALRQQLQDAAPDEFASPEDEIPPHY
jgi:SlyX protein